MISSSNYFTQLETFWGKTDNCCVVLWNQKAKSYRLVFLFRFVLLFFFLVKTLFFWFIRQNPSVHMSLKRNHHQSCQTGSKMISQHLFCALMPNLAFGLSTLFCHGDGAPRNCLNPPSVSKFSYIYLLLACQHAELVNISLKCHCALSN